jgi:hypothetical protein
LHNPSGVVVPPEERIHSLAWLQRQGLITTEEMELAIEQLLGREKPAPAIAEPPPISKAPTSRPASGNSRRVVFAYAATAAVLIVALAMGGLLVGRALFARQPSPQIVASSTRGQPSPSASPSITPAVVSVNLQSILVKLADLRSGYVAGAYDSASLCGACVPVSSSLSITFVDRQLRRTIISGASVSGSVADSQSVVQSLLSFRLGGQFAKSSGLGDESYVFKYDNHGFTYFVVVWRAGAITEELVLFAPVKTRTLQNAIDLAKVQQQRTAAALA